MAKLKLDDKTVRALPAPERGNRIDYDLPKGPRDTDFVRGFAVRTTAAGLRTFLLVYVTADGRERRQKIGDFGPFTVTTARDAARKLRMTVDAGGDPFANAKAKRQEAEAKREQEGATFGGLLMAYVTALHRAKKPSASQVEAELDRTIKKPLKRLWNAPASSITVDDLVHIVNRLAQAGTWRQAEKTRSYLRAAYAMARRAKMDASISDVFEPFRSLLDIARDIGTIQRPKDVHEASKKNRKQALSVEQLRAYWRHIKSMQGPHGAMLRFHLLTGGQRIKQLERLTTADYNDADKLIHIRDAKGRRSVARDHFVPLLPAAAEALDIMRGDAGPYLFSLDKGKSGIIYQRYADALTRELAKLTEAGDAMEATPGSLRVTVETRLAALGVTKDNRGQLQSHGLGGVQDRSYDRHEYMDEKRTALQRLYDLIEQPGDKVVPIRKAQKS